MTSNLSCSPPEDKGAGETDQAENEFEKIEGEELELRIEIRNKNQEMLCETIFKRLSNIQFIHRRHDKKFLAQSSLQVITSGEKSNPKVEE